MSSDGGYTRQYRRLWCHPAFRSKQEAAVFSWLKDAAQWRDTCLQTRYGPVRLQRGEVLIAERELADDFGLARNTLRALLDRMVSMGMVALVRGDGRAPQRAGTILRVCNYDAYQLTVTDASLGAANGANTGPHQDRSMDRGRTASGAAESLAEGGFPAGGGALRDRIGTAERTENGPLEDRTRTKNKEGKEGKEGKEVTPSLRSDAAAAAGAGLPAPEQTAAAAVVPLAAPRAVPDPKGHRLPADWQPNADDRAYAVKLGLDPDRVAEDFRDYWHAQPGAKGRMTSWGLTWKRRCRQLAERAAERRGAAPAPLFAAAAQRAVPAEAGGWDVAAIVERCYQITDVDFDGKWDSNEFSQVIAEVLARGDDPDRSIIPVMRRAARRQGGAASIDSVGFFRAAFGLRTHPLRVVA